MLNIEKLLESLEKRLLREQEKVTSIKEHIALIKKSQTSLPLK